MNGIKGLNNIGNTCYLNSGLQMLLQNEDLCQLIIHYKNNSEQLTILANFITNYYNINNTIPLTPTLIKKLVEDKKSLFIGNKQHDSAEFIVYLLDLINDDITDKLDTIYGIVSQTTIKCKLASCLNTSTINEKNYYLILSIKPEYKTLDDCYRGYKIHEKLENDNMYFCEKCNKKRIASKKINITSWPTHLIIWLKRFDNINGKLKKIDYLIDIPTEWRHNYMICGAVFHSGNLNGGHYIYLLQKNNIWYMCDDSFISIIKDDQINSYLNKAYLLYYKKKHVIIY
jgi:ubiquitin C-terminal hydrolase